MAGLNGDPVFTARDVPVGKVSGEPYGHKGRTLTVTVDVRMERLTRRDTYETVDHDTVIAPLDFALTTAVWHPRKHDWVSGGATIEPLRKLISYTNGFDAHSVRELRRLAEWHLNAMQAGCAHQTVVYEDSDYGRRPSLDLTPACPDIRSYHVVGGRVTGYRYGHAWLVRVLPDDFLSRVHAVFARDGVSYDQEGGIES